MVSGHSKWWRHGGCYGGGSTVVYACTVRQHGLELVKELAQLGPCTYLLLCSTIISSYEGSRSLSSQVSCTCGVVSRCTRKDLWPICIVSRPRLTSISGATYVSAIPDNVHVRLTTPLTEHIPSMDPNNSDAIIITFQPFYFFLGFMFLLSKFFGKVFRVMERAPS
ncbi:PREDICTED: LRR receptor serine/threonine- [Prunus dulcis]|uniref:PREDICTED: LRR receptor serine/threonine n=1 Tax=Prunus dulcis TaxID=3755 RepID=A0A5E4EHM0_PRUDU|nr:hypothetical protein L3X38_043458 [Prunus dulcis]VVA15124.1 PREDICTED: LRR receptor serine/threonine- [Prunus dulcis]